MTALNSFQRCSAGSGAMLLQGCLASWFAVHLVLADLIQSRGSISC